MRLIFLSCVKMMDETRTMLADKGSGNGNRPIESVRTDMK